MLGLTGMMRNKGSHEIHITNIAYRVRPIHDIERFDEKANVQESQNAQHKIESLKG